MRKTKWVCEECGIYFRTKRELIEHLKEELEEANQTIDYCIYYLEELGIKNPYK